MIDKEQIMQLVLILLTSFMGALCNDYYEIITEQDEKVNVARVMLGAIASAFLMYAATEYIFIYVKYITKQGLLLIYFVSGIGGFKTFKDFREVRIIKTIKKAIRNIIRIRNEEDEDDLF